MGFDQVSDMSKNIYERLQDKLMKSKILYTIRVETVTPILIGGYDGRCYHGNKLGFEGLRVSSIKGIWRWWARALIAAAMMRKHNSYLTLDIADSLIAKIFGSTKISSKYAIMIFPRKFKMENYELIIENNKPVKQYNTISRIKLISQRKNLRREYAIKPHAQFEIAIYRNRNSKQNEDEFIIWSLITSLLFDGIGKACSRGFGKVKILKVLGDNVEDLNTLLQKLYSSENIENIEKYLKDIINRATEKAENIIDLLKNEHSELGRLADKPLIEIPLIEDKLMIIEIPNKPFNKPADVIKAISNATLKLYHKMLKYLKQNNERQARQHAMSESGRDVHTWFLGMPRAQEPAIIPDSNKQN
ncbi:MAG: type III-B CRISPR module RAMP protein Cmr1, partial [Thermoprotei archaeon]